jgi:hypothetical protein
MTTAIIRVFCPPMPVYRIGFGKFETAREPCEVEVEFPDGTIKRCSECVIPPTSVLGIFPDQKVSACTGTGMFDDGSGEIVWLLPPEPVLNGTAQPILTTGTVAIASRGIGTIALRLPAAKTSWIGIGEFQAEAVYAEGTVEFP